MSQRIKPLGIIGPDLPDERDRIKPVPTRMFLDQTPQRVSLIDPDDWQWRVQRGNSCFGFAAADAAGIHYSRLLGRTVQYSAYWIYWHGRSNPREDSGTMMRHGMRAMHKRGLIEEELMPDFATSVRTTPPPIPESHRTYLDAGYERIAGTADERWYQLRYTLGIERQPVVAGLPVWPEMMRSGWWRSEGRSPFTSIDANQPHGWHAMVITGFDGQDLLTPGSWGPWGDTPDGLTYIDREVLEYADLWQIARKEAW